MINKKGFFIKKKSVLFQFLFSYLCVLLIPIIIGGLVYIKSVDTIENEINNANFAILKQVQQTIDGKLLDVEKMCAQIDMDLTVRGLLFAKEITPYNSYILSTVINDFKSYMVTNRFIKDFYVYFRNTDLVLTSVCSYNAKELVLSVVNEEEAGSRKWDDIVDSGQFIRHLSSIGIEDGNQSIVFVQSLPIAYTREALGAVIVYLDNSEFKKSIANIKWVSQGTVFIMDKNDQVLFSSGDNMRSDFIRYEQLTNESMPYYIDLNGKKFVISYVKSQFTDIKYISIIPKDILMEKASFIRGLFFTSLILCMFFGVAIVYYFSRKNYNPISDIIHILAEKNNINENKKVNEFNFIKGEIIKTLEEKDEAQQRLLKQKAALRNNFLTGVITGRVNDDFYVSNGFEYFNILFKSDKFAVIIFYIEDFSNLFYIENNNPSKETLKLVSFIICNIVEELSEEKHKSYMAEVDGMLVCLVNINKAVTSPENDLKEIIVNAKKFIENKFGVYFSAAVSSIHESVSSIPDSYREAMQAMEYRLIAGSGEVIQYNDIKTSNNKCQNYGYLLQEAQPLFNSLKAGDCENARNILDNIFRNNFYNKPINVSIAKCRMFSLINVMIAAIEELDTKNGKGYFEGIDIVDVMFNCKTVKELHKQMNNVLNEFESYIKSMKSNKSSMLKDDIIKLVSDNYSDPNLSVSIISERLNLGVDYISRAFKKCTGIGLLDYIHMERIKKAKELLSKNTLTIKNISEEIGYSNTDAFIRVFKKLEGVTPGKYREMY